MVSKLQKRVVVCKVQKLTGQKSSVISVRLRLCFSSSIKRVTACLICFSSSHADPAYYLQLQVKKVRNFCAKKRKVGNCFVKVCWSSLKMPSPLQSTKSTNALTHPAQPWHTLRYWMSSTHAVVKDYNWRNVTWVHNANSVYYELTMNEQAPVKKLHIDKWKDLCEQLANQEWRHLQCNSLESSVFQ